MRPRQPESQIHCKFHYMHHLVASTAPNPAWTWLDSGVSRPPDSTGRKHGGRFAEFASTVVGRRSCSLRGWPVGSPGGFLVVSCGYLGHGRIVVNLASMDEPFHNLARVTAATADSIGCCETSLPCKHFVDTCICCKKSDKCDLLSEASFTNPGKRE